MRKGVSLVWGVFLVGAGILLLSDRFGGLHLNAPWKLWPMLVIALAAGELADGRVGAFAGLLVAGLALLTASFGWFGLSFGNLWPSLLVALGLGLVVGALEGPRRGRRHLPPAREGARREWGGRVAWIMALCTLASALAWTAALSILSAAASRGTSPALESFVRALGRVARTFATLALPLLPAILLAGMMLVLAALWAVSWKGRTHDA